MLVGQRGMQFRTSLVTNLFLHFLDPWSPEPVRPLADASLVKGRQLLLAASIGGRACQSTGAVECTQYRVLHELHSVVCIVGHSQSWT